MSWIDWAIVLLFCGASLGLGALLTGKAGRSLNEYFASNQSLSWWLAGTSMAATAFSSDTPLLVTGMVRSRGVWGTWEILALAISTMMAVFVFAKLWKRAGVLTEVEFVERRYSGRPAAFLRAFKAVYWGLAYNAFVMGAWPVTGLRKVLEETTGLSKEWAIVSSVLLAAVYTSCSGLWGVMVTDLFQFVWMMAAAVLLAVVAVQAVGGLGAMTQALAGTGHLAVIPPLEGGLGGDSTLSWFLGLILVQWWAWKNTDGGGILVQRLVSCKDERQAMWSVLWFNIAQYCLRAWPWIITALASLILIPNAALPVLPGGQPDHEVAYPRLILQLLPVGWRGVLLASFFGAFLSTISTHLNWGASYLVNDVYRRFLRPAAEERHYIAVSRLMPYVLALAAMGVAFAVNTVGGAFTLILNLTAGIGPVYLLRWFWWRINPWSEIAAMAASVPVLLIRGAAIAWLGLPDGLLTRLLFMVAGTAAIWLPATWLTPPVDRWTLKRFYAAVRPPGWWKPVAIAGRGQADRWGWSLLQWIISSVALLATAWGPLQLLLGQIGWGACWTVVGAAGWAALALTGARPGAPPAPTLRIAAPAARRTAAG
jgi:Na+/proline symporter